MSLVLKKIITILWTKLLNSLGALIIHRFIQNAKTEAVIYCLSVHLVMHLVTFRA